MFKGTSSCCDESFETSLLGLDSDGEEIDIPVKVNVTYYTNTPPSGRPAHLCDSPDEYYGDSEIEFAVYNTETGKEMDVISKNDYAQLQDEAYEHMGDLAKSAKESYEEAKAEAMMESRYCY